MADEIEKVIMSNENRGRGMKEGWKEARLGDICRVINGRAYLKPEMLNEGKYRLLRVGNFFTNDSWYYTNLELEEDKYCKEGDLLYAWSASFGPKIWHGEKVVYHYHIWKMVCNETIVNKYFMFHWLNSEALKKQTMTNLHGSTMAHITKNIIENSIVSYPSLSEQQSIVAHLDASFAEIDALKAKAAEEVANAKAMFDAALREEMTPKEGWEEKTLPDISENLDCRRKPVTKGKREEGIYPYYGASGIVDYVGGFLYDEDILLISEDGANLLARSTPIAFSVSGKVWVNNHAHVLKFPTLTQQYFVEYYFASINISEYVTGAAQPKLSQKNLNIIPIPVPPLADQQHIVAKLDTLRSHLTELEQKYNLIAANCDALKQAILRETFE